jgi:hypothetical protein
MSIVNSRNEGSKKTRQSYKNTFAPNPFDQELNTTDSVVFNNLRVTGSFNSPRTELGIAITRLAASIGGYTDTLTLWPTKEYTFDKNDFLTIYDDEGGTPFTFKVLNADAYKSNTAIFYQAYKDIQALDPTYDPSIYGIIYFLNNGTYDPNIEPVVPLRANFDSNAEYFSAINDYFLEVNGVNDPTYSNQFTITVEPQTLPNTIPPNTIVYGTGSTLAGVARRTEQGFEISLQQQSVAFVDVTPTQGPGTSVTTTALRTDLKAGNRIVFGAQDIDGNFIETVLTADALVNDTTLIFKEVDLTGVEKGATIRLSDAKFDANLLVGLDRIVSNVGKITTDPNIPKIVSYSSDIFTLESEITRNIVAGEKIYVFPVSGEGPIEFTVTADAFKEDLDADPVVNADTTLSVSTIEDVTDIDFVDATIGFSVGTQIKQLTDEIDLNVVKNENIISRINLSDEIITINANKIAIGGGELTVNRYQRTNGTPTAIPPSHVRTLDISAYGWTKDIPTGSETLYFVSAVVNLNSVMLTDWSNAAQFSGSQGPPGTEGRRYRELTIYKSSIDTVTTPSGGSYTFGSLGDTFTTPSLDWKKTYSQAYLVDPSVPVWMSTATVDGFVGETDNAITWSTPAIISSPNTSINQVYIRAVSPSKPDDTNRTNSIPNSPDQWYDTVDAVPASSDPLWISVGVLEPTSQYWVWDEPYLAEGVKGDPGDPGEPGETGPPGVDGKSVEFIFAQTEDGIAPVPPPDTDTDFQNDDYVGDPATTVWSDNQRGVDATNIFEWVSKREKVNGVWSAFNSPQIWARYAADGETGADGPGYEIIYRLTTGARPALITDNDPNNDEHVPEEWTDDPGEIDSVNTFLWYATRTKTNGVWSNFSVPKLFARYAFDGKDGKDIEFIFIQTTDSTPVPDVPEVTAPGYQTDDFVNGDWTDDPQGVDATNKYEWVSRRVKVNDVWGAFSTATIWSTFSEDGAPGETGPKGEDGPGVEFIFTTTTDENAPDVPDYSATTPYQNDDYTEAPWTDNQQGVDATNILEWVSRRKKSNGTWGPFNAPQVWARYAADGQPGLKGDDGLGYEIIYTTTTETGTPPTITNVNVDGHVPDGWFDDAQPINEVQTKLWYANRVKSNGAWNDFSTPKLFSRYAFDGSDGKGIEFIFTRNNNQSSVPNPPATSESGYQNDDYYGNPATTIWTDNPQGVNESLKYEWVSRRVKTDGVWGAFSTATIWANYAEDGPPGPPGDSDPDPVAINYRVNGIPPLTPNPEMIGLLGRDYFVDGDTITDTSTGVFDGTSINKSGTVYRFVKSVPSYWVVPSFTVEDGNVVANDLVVQRFYTYNATIASTLTMGTDTTNGIIQSRTFDGSNGYQLNGQSGTITARNMIATGGTIGGWTINSDGIYNSDGVGLFSNRGDFEGLYVDSNNYLGRRWQDPEDKYASFRIGEATRYIAFDVPSNNFRIITPEFSLTNQGLSLTGEINATGGTIGNMTINNNLVVKNSNNTIDAVTLGPGGISLYATRLGSKPAAWSNQERITWTDGTARAWIYGERDSLSGQGNLILGSESGDIFDGGYNQIATQPWVQTWVQQQGYITSSGANNYANSVDFNINTGDLTIGRVGLTDLTENLDGRYLTDVPQNAQLYGRMFGAWTLLTPGAIGAQPAGNYLETGDADNYGSWNLQAQGGTSVSINSGDSVNITGGENVTVTRSVKTIEISASGFLTSTAADGAYSPLGHDHSWSDITSGIPATATRWPSWTEVTSKPSTFTPSAHTLASHSDVTLNSLSGGQTIVWDGVKFINTKYSYNNLLDLPTLFTQEDADQRYLQTVPQEYVTLTQADGRYLQSVPSEYLTQTEGDSRYDDYGSWTLQANSGSSYTMSSGRVLNLVGGSNITVNRYSAGNVEISATGFLTTTTADASYSPLGHDHSWSDITSGIPATATRWPDWSEVDNKPTTFAPSSHSLSFHSDVTIDQSLTTNHVLKYSSGQWRNDPLDWSSISGGSVNEWGGLTVTTASGYIKFGPANTTWAHIYSDRPFYFDQQLHVLGNRVYHEGFKPSVSNVSWSQMSSSDQTVSVLASVAGDYSTNPFVNVINAGSDIQVSRSGNSVTISHGNTSNLNGTYYTSQASGKALTSITVDDNGHVQAVTFGEVF